MILGSTPAEAKFTNLAIGSRFFNHFFAHDEQKKHHHSFVKSYLPSRFHQLQKQGVILLEPL
jgi:hypothetical protein